MFSNVLSNAVVFEQAHPLDVSDYVNRHLGHHKLDLQGLSNSVQDGSARLRYCDFAGMGLSAIGYGGDVRVRCPELEEIYHLQIVTQGRCLWSFRDEQLTLSRGQALMMNPGERMDLIYSADCEKIIVKVPEALIRGVGLEQSGHLPGEGVRFDRKVVSLDHSAGFMHLLDALLTEANETELDISQLHLPYRELLIRKLLQQFDNNARQQADTDSAAYDRSLQQLIRHIKANIREELSVEELAQVGNVSVRTVYNLFAKHFSITPKQYIKQLKLKSLRETLKSSTGHYNVTSVALDYGFTHLGRFSSDYRKMFGELPSETIKRRS